VKGDTGNTFRVTPIESSSIQDVEDAVPLLSLRDFVSKNKLSRSIALRKPGAAVTEYEDAVT